jgi:hypothetical protein
MTDKPEFRIVELIAALGGVPAVRQKLLDHGYPAPPINTIWGWHRRGLASWALALADIAEKEEIVSNVNQLRKKGE